MIPRGGRRGGAPGQSYSNRTDLNTSKALPINVAPGQAYGQRKLQEDAQRTIPLAPPPVPNVGGGATPTQPLPGPAPGELPPLTGPTGRPQEPVTSGLPIGAGPGPMMQPSSNGSMASTLQLLAQATGNKDLLDLAQRAEAMG